VDGGTGPPDLADKRRFLRYGVTKTQPVTAMSLPSSVAQLQREHVVMELECIDRMYLNAYVPKLTTEGGIASFFRGYLGHRFASTKAAGPMTDAFIRAIRDFIHDQNIPGVRFQKGQRKDDLFQKHLRNFKAQEGVVFVGVAQEKVRVPRTVRKTFGQGGTVPWIDYTTAMVNVYYFYCKDKDFGPFFIKFCSYFPYTAKLCLNGHEYLKCQLTHRQIPFEALDNGLLSCADLKAAQRICDGLDAPKIDAFFRKWLKILPHPFSAKDRRAGYRYDLSILQAEFSLTQVWERGVHGRCFFHLGTQAFQKLQQPIQVEDQRASALRFGDPRVQALLAVLVLFCLQPEGFTHKQLRPLIAQFLGLAQSDITPGRMSYDLRRLRLHGLIERKRGTQRYQLTSLGLKTALFYSRIYQRVIRPGLSLLNASPPHANAKLTRALQQFETELSDYLAQQKAA
jgi:hypothetical protein